MPRYAYPGPYIQRAESEIRSGFALNYPRRTAAVANRLLYDNNLDALFNVAVANDVNGMELLSARKRDILRLGYFQRFTDTVTDFLMSAPLSMTGNVGALGGETAVINAVEDAVTETGVTGLGVLIAPAGGEVFAVESDTVLAEYRADEGIVGWVWIQLYHDGPASDVEQAPNRAVAHWMAADGGDGWRREFEFAGNTFGALVTEDDAGGALVSYIGRGSDPYAGLRPVLREVMVRYTLRSRVINRHASPHLEGPAEAAAGFRYQAGGMYLPLDDENPRGYRYLTWPGGGVEADQHLERLLEEVHAMSGVPPVVLGLAGRGRNTPSVVSGTAEDVAMFPMWAKVRRLRRMLQIAFVELGNVGLAWTDGGGVTQTAVAGQ